MVIKSKKIDAHPDFHTLLIQIQTERIKNGKETVQNKIALWRLTKTITNMIQSNKEIFKLLCEVDKEDGV